jgi:hypothetical protein
MLGAGGGAASAFPPASRYHGLPLATHVMPGGRTVVYVRRRLVPPADRFTPVAEHVVAQGERLDLIAAAHLGDPEAFWRLCDANGAMAASELETPGRRLAIALPEAGG